MLYAGSPPLLVPANGVVTNLNHFEEHLCNSPPTFKMGRWTQYDEDDYRLPEGMERIGYDADTMRYCFRDRDGSLWKGAEGAEFGEMNRVDRLPSSVAPYDYHYHQPLSTEPSRPTADRSTRSYRTLFPFSLLSPSSFSFCGIWSSRRDSRFFKKKCPEGTSSY